jgi:hypothetical protein
MRINIQCINKSDRSNAHERIINCGGVSGTARWKKTQVQIINDIESRTTGYFVKVGSYREVDVIVATSRFGNKYIKTTEDGEMPNNLLSLPECP